MTRQIYRTAILLAGILTAIATGGGGSGELDVSEGLKCIFDTIPVNFLPVQEAELNTLYTSEEIRTGDLCTRKYVEISAGGEYSVNGGVWRTDRIEIRPGVRIRVRLTSAGTFATLRSTTLRIGSLQANGLFNPFETSSGTFRVTTMPGQADEAPIVAITSPVDQSQVEARSILVTGTASDADGIQEVLVNGNLAQTDDGFNTWSAEVELATGSNTITVETADTLLNRNPQAAQVTIENLALLLIEPAAITADTINNRLLVVDRGWQAVIAIDLSDDSHTIVSDTDQGVALQNPIKILASPARETAWILDGNYERLIQVDLVSGERTLLDGAGDPLSEAYVLAIDEARSQLYVLSGNSTNTGEDRNITRIDLGTGQHERFSDNSIPDDINPFGATWSMAFDAAGDRILVLQPTSPGALAVDPVTGARTPFSEDGGRGAVHAYVDETFARVIYATRQPSEIRAFDLVTSDRQILWPVRLGEAWQIAPDLLNNRILVKLRYQSDIVAVDLTTGENTVVY